MTVTGIGGRPVPLSISTACGGPLSLSTAAAAVVVAATLARISGTKHRRLTALLNFYADNERGFENRRGAYTRGAS